MNQTDPYATLRAAEAAGARIQANRGTMESPHWVTLSEAAEFSCPANLYRVHPEDVADA